MFYLTLVQTLLIDFLIFQFIDAISQGRDMSSNQVHILNVPYLTTSSTTLTEVFRYLLSPVGAFFQTILENGLEKRFEGEPNWWKQWLQPEYHHFLFNYPGFNGRHGGNVLVC